jgi:hypothetical protein
VTALHDGGAIAVFNRPPQDCVVCGADLGLGPWWVTDHPRGAHEACVDWSRRPFPYAWVLPVARAAWRAHRSARAELGALGRELAGIEARWPAGGAGAVARAGAIKARLHGLAQELGDERLLKRV